MHDPRYGSQAATMFLCGDDAEAKGVVAQLGEDLGFAMLNAGPLAIARLLEPLAMLWIHLAVFQGLGLISPSYYSGAQDRLRCMQPLAGKVVP